MYQTDRSESHEKREACANVLSLVGKILVIWKAGVTCRWMNCTLK